MGLGRCLLFRLPLPLQQYIYERELIRILDDKRNSSTNTTLSLEAVHSRYLTGWGGESDRMAGDE